MELKGRLGAVASRIPACRTLADVGTDHAYIPIFAVSKGICGKALATDVRPGPVKAAERNIKRYGMGNRIEARLGYGLQTVAPGEAQVAVIAGMGGPLICEILQTSRDTASMMDLLVLQPMNAQEALRKWLNDSGFLIREELLACEGKKLYNIICALWKGQCETQDDYETYIGKELLQSSDPLLSVYLEKKLGQLDVIVEGMKKSGQIKEELDRMEVYRERLKHDLRRISWKGART